MRYAWVTLLLLAGCSTPVPAPPPAGNTGTGCAPGQAPDQAGICGSSGLPANMTCAPGERQGADGCVAAGVSDLPCPPGQTLSDGDCLAAGIPPDACGDGFEHDGAFGCQPILPARDCDPGMIAIPGDAVCRPLVDCGEGRWGNIPVDETTAYVDASYEGESNGSEDQPWTSINYAINFAEAGSIIAVAAGSYPEPVIFGANGPFDDPTKHAKVWGRCPSMVEIDAGGLYFASLGALNGGAGSEFHNVSVIGDDTGVAIYNSGDVLLSGVWIHDIGEVPLVIDGDLGDTQVTLDNILVEDSPYAGVLVNGADVTLTASVVRNMDTNVNGQGGLGVFVQAGEDDGKPASLIVERSVVSNTRFMGIGSAGADLQIDSTVVRGTRNGQSPSAALPDFTSASGLLVSPNGHHPDIVPAVSITRSAFLGNYQHGITLHHTKASIDATVVADTQFQFVSDDEASGVSLVWEHSGSRETDPLTIERSWISNNAQRGISSYGFDLVLDRVRVSDTQTMGGVGSGVASADNFGAAAALTVRDSVVTGNHEHGILMRGGVLSVMRSELSHTQSTAGASGVGLMAVFLPASPDTVVEVSDTVFSDNEGGAVWSLAAASAVIENSTVRATRVGPINDAAIIFASTPGGPQVQGALRGVLVEDNDSPLALLVEGSEVDISECAIASSASASGERQGVQVNSGGLLTIAGSLIEDARGTGLFVFESEAFLQQSAIRNTHGLANDVQGSAVVVADGMAGATVTIDDCLLDNNDGAAIAIFSAHVDVEGLLGLCNGHDVVSNNDTAVFVDRGRTSCGCPTGDRACAPEATSQSPPTVLLAAKQ